MPKQRYPITPAVRFLRSKQVAFKPRIYTYLDRGGARQAAEALRVPEHRVVKTLVLATPTPPALLMMLMHADREVSLRRLARIVGVKRMTPAKPSRATAATGYQVGGISPFGTRQQMPVYVQKTILDLPTLLINGGKRGFLIELVPAVLTDILSATPVDAAI